MNTLAVTICLSLLVSSLLYQPTQSRTLPAAVLPITSYGPRFSPQEACPRGAAKPVVKKAVFPKTTFRLQPDKRTGIETVTCPNGDQVIIRHEGCEYYALRFEFTTSRFAPPTTALEPWFRNAATLMTGLLSGLDAPLDLRQGVRALTAHIDQDKKNQYRNLALGQAISFGDETMPSTVSIDSLARSAGKNSVVEVTFAIGPL
ncbi:hypothetical protein [Hymenobacter cellulosivorans]|uniref:DUF4403 family protein n=1 Tax=Hymenobacter cellulosivorans TaxID=2932249 RepID=A0ABY4F6H9_9BACT|nr:hypothetical protein [Hymenobacter cellulosivorans]UOQ52185.1 hypothetical protein MUN80_20785 [Hymenobacter cellulosivorans]